MTPSSRVLPARYEGVELVARGGMADVYRATDSLLARTVAAKVLAERYAALPDFRERFEREALTAAPLTHPNVVTIFDVGEYEGGPYIVMEYLPGGSLADRLSSGPIPADTAMEWLGQAAGALDAAHAAGVIHRDVKPGNLLLDGDDVVHVTDFGIARVAAHDPLTATGTILGSAGYMAPEQARGERATAASDRYALGCVAFELLTRHRPFEAESPTAEALLHDSEPPPHASEIEPSLPAAVDAVLLRALAKDPDARQESAKELVDELRDALSGDDARTRILPPRPHREPFRRRRYRAATALAVLLALAGAATAVALALGDIGFDEPRRGTEGRPTAPTTAQVQATEPPPPPKPPPPPPPEPAPPPPTRTDSVAGAAAANDRAYQLMLDEDFESALPVLEDAYRVLAGTGVTAEAYTAYNLAFTRFALGSCDGVLDLLDRSEAVQGERREISRLRKRAEKQCA